MAKQTDDLKDGLETPNILIIEEQSIIHHVPVYPGDIRTATSKGMYSKLKFRIAHISASHFFPKVVAETIADMLNQYCHAMKT